MRFLLLFLGIRALFAVEGEPVVCRRVNGAADPRALWNSIQTEGPKSYTGLGRTGDHLEFVETEGTCYVTYWPDRTRPENFSKGFFESSWRGTRGKRTYVVARAFLDDGLGSTLEIPRETEGVRTAVLANLRLLKSLAGEDCYGTINELRLATVVNFKTILHLHVAEKQWRDQNPGDELPPEARRTFFESTSLYRYMRELAEATGHRIRRFEIDGGHPVDVADFTQVTLQERAARDRALRNAELAREKKVDDEEKIFARFNVRFWLVPSG